MLSPEIGCRLSLSLSMHFPLTGHTFPRVFTWASFSASKTTSDAALASMLTAVTANPGNALAQSEYGRTLEAAGKDEAATPYLEQAIKLNPDLPGARNELAMALQRQGRQQEAIPWFQQAIQREPRNVSALTNLGLALTLTGKSQRWPDLLPAGHDDCGARRDPL